MWWNGYNAPIGHTPKLPIQSAGMNSDFEYYFAYASDLLSARLQLGSPSAVKVDVVKLDGFKFGFSIYSKVWKGGEYGCFSLF